MKKYHEYPVRIYPVSVHKSSITILTKLPWFHMDNSPLTAYFNKLNGAYSVCLNKYTVIDSFDGLVIHQLLL
jgi:hypothetical protein